MATAEQVVDVALPRAFGDLKTRLDLLVAKSPKRQCDDLDLGGRQSVVEPERGKCTRLAISRADTFEETSNRDLLFELVGKLDPEALRSVRDLAAAVAREYQDRKIAGDLPRDGHEIQAGPTRHRHIENRAAEPSKRGRLSLKRADELVAFAKRRRDARGRHATSDENPGNCFRHRVVVLPASGTKIVVVTVPCERGALVLVLGPVHRWGLFSSSLKVDSRRNGNSLEWRQEGFMKSRALVVACRLLIALSLLGAVGCPTSGGGDPSGQSASGATAEITYPIVVEASAKEAGVDEATKHNASLDAKCAFLDISADLLSSRPEGLGCPRPEIEGAN